MSVTEEPGKPRNLQERLHIIQDRIYDRLFHNYVWQSIFRSGYPNTPRNQMLVVATNVFLHMMRVFYTGAYKPPREFNWVVGVVLLVLTLVLSFTGYLLPWDQLALWAVTVGHGIGGSAPYLGGEGQTVVFGGVETAQPALIRFYTLHVIALPLLAAIMMAVHFWRIRRDGGMARPL